jgi:serine/threonine protein kinase
MDIWSFGVIVYTQFFGAFPYTPAKWSGAAMKECIRRNAPAPTFQPARELDYHGQVSGQALAFVKALLVRDADERPTADAAMQLDYLKHASEFAAEARRSKRVPPCLFPMLYGAIKAGVFTQRAPQPSAKVFDTLDFEKKIGARAVHRPHDISESSTKCDSNSTVTTGVSSDTLSKLLRSKSGSTGVNSDALSKWSKSGSFESRAARETYL